MAKRLFALLLVLLCLSGCGTDEQGMQDAAPEISETTPEMSTTDEKLKPETEPETTSETEPESESSASDIIDVETDAPAPETEASDTALEISETETENQQELQTEPKAEEPETIIEDTTDLAGNWVEKDFESRESYMFGTVTDTDIELYWCLNKGEFVFLYWAGTYTPPTEPGAFSWTSANDTSRTSSEMFTSSDPEKVFEYADGVITYSQSALGETRTVSMIKGTSPVAEQLASEVVAYEISYNNIDVWENSIGTTWYQGIVEIVNTGNVDLMLESGRFDIENPDGTLFASKNYISAYPQIISPGEKGYYYDASTLEGADLNAQYKIVPKIEAVKSTSPKIRLTAKEFRIEDTEYFGMKAIGRVENTSEQEQKSAHVTVVCFDEEQKPIYVFSGYADDMKPGDVVGEEISEFASVPGLTAESIKNFEVYVYPTQYQFNW